jgi:hypothetical protein
MHVFISSIILNGLCLLISRQSRRAFVRNADVLLVFSRQLNCYPAILVISIINDLGRK